MSALVKFRKKFGAFSLSVDFEAENEVLALLGGSGCGKSMTLKCIAGIVTPDEGKIVVDGVTFFDSERGVNLKPQQRRCGLLFQNYALFPNMTAKQNIMTVLRRGSGRCENSEARYREIAEKFFITGLEEQVESGKSVTVTLEPNNTTLKDFTVKWYLDGNYIDEGESISFETDSGQHRLDAVAYTDKIGSYGSTGITFEAYDNTAVIAYAVGARRTVSCIVSAAKVYHLVAKPYGGMGVHRIDLLVIIMGRTDHGIAVTRHVVWT